MQKPLHLEENIVAANILGNILLWHHKGGRMIENVGANGLSYVVRALCAIILHPAATPGANNQGRGVALFEHEKSAAGWRKAYVRATTNPRQ